jgi:predicted cupin superfamily sugar epimerase
MKNLKIAILFVLCAAFMSSCSAYINTLKEYNAQEGDTYPGTVLLKSGVQLAGRVAFPNLSSKTVLFINQKDECSDLQATEIEKIELHHASAPGKVHSIYYLLMKKNSNSWVVQMDESKYITAYISAAGYKIRADGSLELGGYMRSYSTGPNGARSVEQPSFPVYMKKKRLSFQQWLV